MVMPSLTESNSLPFGTASEAATQTPIISPAGNGYAASAPPSELVQAVNVVARAVQARISVLQAEIDSLRKALQPFKSMGGPNQDVFATGGDDAVNELLAIARKLGSSNAGG